jgi:hypothetical protein
MIDFGTVQAKGETHGSLTDDYVVPPFSVLDTRQGYWQERRRRWLSLGIKSEVGRTARTFSEDMMRGEVDRGYGGTHDAALASPGTSIFDPVLCELAYRWWCPPGGSVRGIVASKLGHPYVGVDLSAVQVAANQEQAQALLDEPDPAPRWLVGDSVHLSTVAGPLAADMVFTCPPYFDLEVYSDEAADLSAAPNYATFLDGYRAVLAAAVGMLKPGRFAVVVVSEIRDKRGVYRGFVPDTIAALRDAGAEYYNEAILVNSAGSLPLRAGAYMRSGRKLGRAHQNIICAVKGGWDEVRGWDAERVAPPDPQLSMWGGVA